MRFSKAHSFRLSLLKIRRPNLPRFVERRNADNGDALFAPASDDGKGHMLHVFVMEKDAFQIVDDDVDGPVGGVPYLGVVGAPRRDDFDLDEGFFKIGQRFFLPRLSGCRLHQI